MKVFLTGATGYIGSVVAEKLIARGHSVLGLSRSSKSAEAMVSRNIEPLSGDLLNPESLARGARDSDGTIHAGFMHDLDDISPESFAKAATAEQANISAMIDAMVDSSKPLVITSGTGVIGDTGEAVFTEETPFQAPPYMEWRQKIEVQVREAAKKHIRSSLIRPPMVFGRGGSLFPTVLLNAGKKAGIGRYIGTGLNQWSTIHVDDLADLYVAALERAPGGNLFHSTHGSPVTVKAMAEAVSVNLGVAGRTESWSMDDARKEIGMLAGGLAANMRVSSQQTQELLGWTPYRLSIVDDLASGSYAHTA